MENKEEVTPKVGDVIVCVAGGLSQVPIGQRMTVTRVDGERFFYIRGDGREDYWWLQKPYFEIDKNAIVINILQDL